MPNAYDIGRRAGQAADKRIRESRKPALTGKLYDDGSVRLRGSTATNDLLPTNKVYVRLSGEASELREAWNTSVANKSDMAVVVVKNYRNEYEVVGLDDRDATAFMGEAARDFATPERLGVAPNLTAARDFLPARLQLAKTGTLKVNVAAPFWYIDSAGDVKRWVPQDPDGPDGNSLDLASNVPSSGQRRWVNVDFDPDASSPGFVATNGTAQVLSLPFDESLIESIAVTDGNYPLAAIELQGGDTTITDDKRIVDRRVYIEKQGDGAAVADEKAKVSANDTTAGYLNGKLVAGAGISLTENSDGGNETLTIAALTSGGSALNVTTDDLVVGVELYRNILATTAASLDSGTISNDYDYWVVKVALRTNAADAGNTDVANWSLNGDTTTTNYRTIGNFVQNTSGTTATNYPSGADDRLFFSVPDASALTDGFAYFELVIPRPGSSARKQVFYQAARRTGANEQAYTAGAMEFESTAALTSIAVAPDGADSFVAGSYLIVVGYKAQSVVTDVTGGGAVYSDDNVSNPPSEAEINTAFGTAATAGAGFIGVIDDSGAGTNVYFVVSTGAKWAIFTGTIAS